jgi:hypothetical protein
VLIFPTLTWPKLPSTLCLWRFLQYTVYRTKPRALEKLREETEKPCAFIPADTLATVSSALGRKTLKCLNPNGQKFDNLLQLNTFVALSFWTYKIWIINKVFKQIFRTRKCAYTFEPLRKSSCCSLELRYKDDSFKSRSGYSLSSKWVSVVLSFWAYDWLQHSNRPRLPA